jgi:hypothetical protein
MDLQNTPDVRQKQSPGAVLLLHILLAMYQVALIGMRMLIYVYFGSLWLR